jgi:hypothetical protein
MMIEGDCGKAPIQWSSNDVTMYILYTQKNHVQRASTTTTLPLPT